MNLNDNFIFVSLDLLSSKIDTILLMPMVQIIFVVTSEMWRGETGQGACRAGMSELKCRVGGGADYSVWNVN